MKAIKFEEKIVIRETPEVIFDFTQDYQNRLEWDTFLKKAELIHGAKKAGLGVQSYCVAQNGLGMTTEYVSFNRPKVVAIKMTQGPFFFKSFLGSWRFKPLNSVETEVSFLYSFQLAFPFSLFNGLVKKTLVRNVKQRLVDLKKYLEK
jgi:ribosome-associated toxin RatA of RatAB toxin-antitoxin module